MVAWPATFKCNQNCISCILNTTIVSKIPDPPLEQVFSIVDRLNPKKDVLEITGGEPTLRKELFEVLDYVNEKNPELYTFIVTNGVRLSDKKYVEMLVKHLPKNHMIGIAMYADYPSLHDFITRLKGSFEHTVRGVKNITEMGVNVEIRYVISRLNYKRLPPFAKFCTKEFEGVERYVLLNMKYTGNAYIARKVLFVKLTEVVPYAVNAVEVFWKRGEYVRLYHFPLCILPKKYREIAEGVTKEEEELTFAPQCKKCKLRSRCPRIWKTYTNIAGFDEFKPILN